MGQADLGTYWVWDARLTSELILFFLYIGFMALQAAIDDPRRADKAGAVLALVGVVNIPIIYFSVQWWNTLHQGASVSLTRSPTMAATMFTGMILMALAFWMYSIAVALAARAGDHPRARAAGGMDAGAGACMNWGSAAEFFAMGGYAPYVWGSFAVVALCMLVEPLAVRARRCGLARIARANAAAEDGMKPRHKRLALGGGGLAVAIAAALVLNAFRSNLVFFFTPSQIAAGEAPRDRAFRIGGMVVAGSLTASPTDSRCDSLSPTQRKRSRSVYQRHPAGFFFAKGKGWLRKAA